MTDILECKDIFSANRTLADVGSPWGAPTGRRKNTENPAATVRLFRILYVDGDYDYGGAYWGGDRPLYAAIGDEFLQFIRAPTLVAAGKQLMEEYPDLVITYNDLDDDFVYGCVEGYTQELLWLSESTDDDDNPEQYAGKSWVDFSDKSLQVILQDCQQQLQDNKEWLTPQHCSDDYMQNAGVRFCLGDTRLEFEPPQYDKEAADALNSALDKFRGRDVCVRDDGKIEL